jgi:protease secretion system membrane fusion protein
MQLIKKEPTTDVVTHDVAPLTVDTDAKAYSRAGWLLLLFGFGGFVLWALFAPLDKGVGVSGNVAVASNRKVIQHPSGGIVDAILVKDGDKVKAGQVLVRMNRVMSESASEATLGQYISLRAMEARLLAERDGRKNVDFPPTLEPYRADPRTIEQIAAQKQLYFARQSALHGELSAMDESMAGLKMQVNGLSESSESKRLQIRLVKEQLDSMRDLAKDGYIPRNRMLEQERLQAQLSGAISEDVGNIGRAQRQLAELAQRRLQRQQEYQKEVREQLANAQREVDTLANRLRAQQFELSTTEMKAPVDGIVVNLAVFTRGGVVTPNTRVMELVPADDMLVVEGQIPVHLIDKVHAGMPVDLIFSAFNQNKTPHIPGVVTWVAADRSVEERNGMPYYRMQAKVAPEGVAKTRDLQIRPGMPVEMFVRTGERTMMNYLFRPIQDRMRSSLSED